jgi:F-type H+-transporting ATPase subunit gamma
MKTVSTAKFQKAQRLVLNSRPYWHTFPGFMHKAVLEAKRARHPLLARRKERKTMLVVITSDKGLCGAFNSNLLERALEYCKQKSQSCELGLVLLGKKAVSAFRRLPYRIEKSYSDKTQNLTDEDLRELARFLMQEYVLSQTDGVYVMYNEFKSILAPRITLLKLLPVEVQGKAEEKTEDVEQVPTSLNPDWEPEDKTFIEVILPGYVEDQIQHFFRESIAAEHASRMIAMDKATQNAEDLIGDLTLVLNKIRQASITKELLEIMTAVEALAKK